MAFGGDAAALNLADMFGFADLTFFLDSFRGRIFALGGRVVLPAAAELVCDDAWDDDDDGLLDCADPQCAGDPACADTGGCRPIVDLACGQTIAGTNADGPTRWPYYGAGCLARDESGPEAYFRVQRTTAGPIQLALTGASADLDLIVSSATGSGACTPDEACLSASQNTGITGESTSFTAAAGTAYVVIVDGVSGGIGTFNLQVSCP